MRKLKMTRLRMTMLKMTKLKALCAVVVLAVAAASPVFARDAWQPRSRAIVQQQPWPYYFRSCFQGPGFGACPGVLYGWSIGRDRSRVGGVAPSLRPSGS